MQTTVSGCPWKLALTVLLMQNRVVIVLDHWCYSGLGMVLWSRSWHLLYLSRSVVTWKSYQYLIRILLSGLFEPQEYPPGVMVVPMRSRTLKPFTTTNLVVFAPENVSVDYKETGFVTRGDALIVDPGCHYKLHTEVFHKSMCSFCSSYHIYIYILCFLRS